MDIPRPLKSRMGNYYETEDTLMDAVAKAFGLSGKIPKEVKEIDNRILVDERSQNMKWTPVPNSEWGAHGEPLGIELRYWPPKIAEAKFLSRFEQLTKK